MHLMFSFAVPKTGYGVVGLLRVHFDACVNSLILPVRV